LRIPAVYPRPGFFANYMRKFFFGFVVFFIFPCFAFAAPKDLWVKFHSLPSSGQWVVAAYDSMPSGGYYDWGVAHGGGGNQIWGYRNYSGDWYEYVNQSLTLETWYKVSADNPSSTHWKIFVDDVQISDFTAPSGADDDLSAGLVCLSDSAWECQDTDPGGGGGGSTIKPCTVDNLGELYFYPQDGFFWGCTSSGWVGIISTNVVLSIYNLPQILFDAFVLFFMVFSVFIFYFRKQK